MSDERVSVPLADEDGAYAERLDTILEHTTNVVFMKDLDGRYVLVNEAFEAFFGFDREDVLGRTAAEIHGEAAAERIRENDAETLRAGEPTRFEERYARGGETYRFVTVRVPLFDDDGEPYAVYGIATDVTNELELAEERAELLDRMTDGFVAVDDEDAITYLNARAAALAERGTENEDAIGRQLWDAFPNAIDTGFARAFAEARRSGDPTSVTTYYEPVDGWFEARIYPSETGVSVYFHDVTESVRERRELEYRENVMQRLYEIISEKDAEFEAKVGSLLELGREVLEVESGVLSHVRGEEYHVEAAADATGAFEEGSRVPLSATNCERVVSTEASLQVGDVGSDPELSERAGYTDLGISCYVGAPVVVEGEVYGTFCFYDRESRPVPFPEWEVTLVDLMARWVSYELERRETQTEVARERDRLDRFASMVSHDLRSPLNVASGNIDLVLEEYDDDRLDSAARALDRMAELIDDALSFARLGERVVDAETIDLDGVAAEAWSTVVTEEATLHAEGLGSVVGDASRVRTLFENLFRNAIEHAGGDATVTVGWEDGALYVADDGPGIPEDVREKAFETGFTTNPDGTGFGLGIVEAIAEAHGWTVAATASDAGGARIEFRGVGRLSDGE